MKDSVYVLQVESVMIWDQYFLARAALVIFSIIAAMCWLIVGVVSSADATNFAWIFLIPFIHSVGMIIICAGVFGNRRCALCCTLIIGLLWFAVAVPMLLQFSELVRSGDLWSVWWILLLLWLGLSGFALFCITWVLVQNSRQVPDHFREF